MSKSRWAPRFGLVSALGIAAAALVASGVSCGSHHGSSTAGSHGGGATGTGSSMSSGVSGLGGLGGGVDVGGTFASVAASASSSSGVDVDAGCAGEASKAQEVPLDIYIMLDQSASMLDVVSGGVTKWTAITTALKSFLAQPGLGGISVGIQYFAVPPSTPPACPTSCTSSADCGLYGPCSADVCYPCGSSGTSADSCDPADYAKPDVEIAPLAGAQIVSLYNSINAHTPYSDTPTSAALKGAIDHAAAWAKSSPGHAVITVLATDGDPTECDPTQSVVDGIAASGASNSPKILTFVIGVGTSFNALNGIAAAGGTTKAFLVDTNQNVDMEFLAALNAIRGAALGCQYQIPGIDGGMVDLTKVNVQYTPGGGGMPEELTEYANKAACPASGDGWYYNDPAAPTLILLCPSTCTKVSADSTGEVDVVLGCKSKQPS